MFKYTISLTVSAINHILSIFLVAFENVFHCIFFSSRFIEISIPNFLLEFSSKTLFSCWILFVHAVYSFFIAISITDRIIPFENFFLVWLTFPCIAWIELICLSLLLEFRHILTFPLSPSRIAFLWNRQTILPLCCAALNKWLSLSESTSVRQNLKNLL